MVVNMFDTQDLAERCYGWMEEFTAALIASVA